MAAFKVRFRILSGPGAFPTITDFEISVCSSSGTLALFPVPVIVRKRPRTRVITRPSRFSLPSLETALYGSHHISCLSHHDPVGVTPRFRTGTLTQADACLILVFSTTLITANATLYRCRASSLRTDCIRLLARRNVMCMIAIA